MNVGVYVHSTIVMGVIVLQDSHVKDTIMLHILYIYTYMCVTERDPPARYYSHHILHEGVYTTSTPRALPDPRSCLGPVWFQLTKVQ